MTVVVQCVLDGGAIRPLEPEKIAKWKDAHKQGEAFDLILSDEESRGQSAKKKLYFALRDEYAGMNGYSNSHAHVELKHFCGVTRPVEEIPEGRRGTVVHYYDIVEWQLSMTAYTDEEMDRLLPRVQAAVDQAKT